MFRTWFHIFDGGRAMSFKYIKGILKPNVKPFSDADGPEFVVSDDNTRPRRNLWCVLIIEYIVQMDCPTYSEHLKPIDHI